MRFADTNILVYIKVNFLGKHKYWMFKPMDNKHNYLFDLMLKVLVNNCPVMSGLFPVFHWLNWY